MFILVVWDKGRLYRLADIIQKKKKKSSICSSQVFEIHLINNGIQLNPHL